ncbi:MAG: hypothetical protein JXR82_12490 [Marinifilaceae bacterium]|nr:hypothetical protein [Marinifilaceae bacterium]
MENENDEIKDWKNRIHEYRKEAASQFNKQLVFLSSGGLILSVGFVKDIVEIKSASSIWLLALAWTLFVISLLSNLFSYQSTMKAMDLELDDKCEDSDKQDQTTKVIDYISIGSLITAITVFILFVALNIF